MCHLTSLTIGDSNNGISGTAMTEDDGYIFPAFEPNKWDPSTWKRVSIGINGTGKTISAKRLLSLR